MQLDLDLTRRGRGVLVVSLDPEGHPVVLSLGTAALPARQNVFGEIVEVHVDGVEPLAAEGMPVTETNDTVVDGEL